MNILVTGSAGFIGTKLLEKLESTGHNVVKYDIMNYNSQDIRDIFTLDKVFSTNCFDAVIHLAARAGVFKSQEFPDEYISTNVTGTYNIIKMCEKYKVKTLINFSSSSVLGGTNSPQEKQNENAPYNPISVYGVSKMAAELLVKQSKLNWYIVRPFSVYGENGRKDMVIYKWIENIKKNLPITLYTDEKNKKDLSGRGFTHVNDLVDGVVKLLDYATAPTINKKIRIFHLGGAEFISMEELSHLVTTTCLDKFKIDVKCKKEDRREEDIKISIADISRAKGILGFKPKKKFISNVIKILKKEL